MAGTWTAIVCLLSWCASRHALANQEPGDMACVWDAATGCSVDPQWFNAVWPASAAEPLGEYRSQLTVCASHSSKSDCLTADCAWYPESQRCRPRTGHWPAIDGPGLPLYLAKLIPQQDECRFSEGVLDMQSCIDITDCNQVKGCIPRRSRRLGFFHDEDDENVSEPPTFLTENAEGDCNPEAACEYGRDYVFQQVCDDFEGIRSRCLADGGDIITCYAAACPAWTSYWDRMRHCVSLNQSSCIEEEFCYYDYYETSKVLGLEVACSAPVFNPDQWKQLTSPNCPHNSWIQADERCARTASPLSCAQNEGCEYEQEMHCDFRGRRRERAGCWASQTYTLEAATSANCGNEQVLSIIRAVQAFEACDNSTASTKAACEMVAVPQPQPECPPAPPGGNETGNETASKASELSGTFALALLAVELAFLMNRDA